MITYILYGLCIILFIISFYKDKNKTKKALINASKSFENIMPQFLIIIIIVAIVLSVITPDTISSIMGEKSGFLGILTASIVGSIAMMPTFVAFSMGDSLLNAGAGYSQVAALITTLTMVGILTFTLESKYIGKKAAFLRNLFAFMFAFAVALIMGVVLG